MVANMETQNGTIVEREDGSVEIYESEKMKSQKFMLFGAASLLMLLVIAFTHSSENIVLRHMTFVYGIPVAIVLVLLTLLQFRLKKPSQPKLAIRFTTEGFTAWTQTGKWADIKLAYTTQYECVLLSRRAGEIRFNTYFLEITPPDLLRIVFRFAPELELP